MNTIMKTLLIAIALSTGVAMAEECSLCDYAITGNLPEVKKLLDEGVDVNATNQYGQTPLMMAAWHVHKPVLDALLEAGADVNTTAGYATGYGWTALMFAARSGNTDIVSTVLEAGADIKSLTREGEDATGKRLGQTALDIAVENGHTDVISMLWDYECPLCTPVDDGDLSEVKKLLDSGADPDAAVLSSGGWPVLMRAIGKGHTDIVKVLLEAGANPNMAVIAYSKDVGEDGKPEETAGWTPLMMAAQEGHTEIVAMLLEQGCPSSLPTAICQTQIATELFGQAVEVNAVSDKGDIALSGATRNGHIDIVKLLFINGANPDLKDSEGFTAWDYIKNQRRIRVVFEKALEEWSEEL